MYASFTVEKAYILSDPSVGTKKPSQESCEVVKRPIFLDRSAGV